MAEYHIKHSLDHLISSSIYHAGNLVKYSRILTVYRLILLLIHCYKFNSKISEQSGNPKLKINLVTKNILDFIEENKDSITNNDIIFLRHSLNVEDPFSYFYITAKVYKDP